MSLDTGKGYEKIRDSVLVLDRLRNFYDDKVSRMDYAIVCASQENSGQG